MWSRILKILRLFVEEIIVDPIFYSTSSHSDAYFNTFISICCLNFTPVDFMRTSFFFFVPKLFTHHKSPYFSHPFKNNNHNKNTLFLFCNYDIISKLDHNWNKCTQVMLVGWMDGGSGAHTAQPQMWKKSLAVHWRWWSPFCSIFLFINVANNKIT